jgi:hypothetical protein
MKQMYSRILFIVLLATTFAGTSLAQRKADKKVIKRLKADISYLASDDLEGRRTGSEGERKAADYIQARYEKEKIAPYQGAYKHPFHFVYGKEIGELTQIKIDDNSMKLKDDAFPMPFSANTSSKLSADILPDVFEQGNIWMIALYNDKEDAANPHFDYEKAMHDRAKEARKQGATAVIFYDNYDAKYPPKFNPLSEFEPLDIPVAFLSFNAFGTYVKDREEGVSVVLEVNIKKTERTGTNVAAYIDNKAPYTVVIGAHYDHLGYGDDGTSLYTGKDKEIHNGADDNASGTAGLLELAARIKKNRLRNYNYLFVHFSGEELGLLGSKAFVKDMGLDSTQIAYMINMDMVGRLNDSTHALTVGGVGTSPVWGQFVGADNKNFKINIDSSGVGPSDHTSFYQAGIPVLFFFTGIHHDYHKPSDDADKINYLGEAEVLNYVYSIVDVMDTRTKPKFTPTKQNSVGKVRFKVTLGIMPDYSFQEEGVRVDGVSDDRPAIKAGIKTGDVIVKLGEYKIKGLQSYMEALSKYNSGQTVEVTVLRGGKPVKMKLTF